MRGIPLFSLSWNVFFIAGAALLSSQAAAAAELKVEIRNVGSSEGSIRVALYASEQAFLKNLYAGQIAPAQKGSIAVRFGDVPPGSYALSVYHDENENGELDKNFLGIPTEPYGFSNNARGMFGPASFGDAMVAIEDQARQIVIRLD